MFAKPLAVCHEQGVNMQNPVVLARIEWAETKAYPPDCFQNWSSAVKVEVCQGQTEKIQRR